MERSLPLAVAHTLGPFLNLMNLGEILNVNFLMEKLRNDWLCHSRNSTMSKYYITSYTCTSLVKSFHHIFKEIREIAHE